MINERYSSLTKQNTQKCVTKTTLHWCRTHLSFRLFSLPVLSLSASQSKCAFHLDRMFLAAQSLTPYIWSWFAPTRSISYRRWHLANDICGSQLQLIILVTSPITNKNCCRFMIRPKVQIFRIFQFTNETWQLLLPQCSKLYNTITNMQQIWKGIIEWSSSKVFNSWHPFAPKTCKFQRLFKDLQYRGYQD